MKRIAVLANGPGELWGWARPVVKELKRDGHEVDLILLPCQFASGAEERISSFLGADRVSPPGRFREALFGRRERRYDCVLQLGGDLLYGRILAREGKIPLFSYSYGPKRGLKACREVFTAFEGMAGQFRGTVPVRVVGDLVPDALAMDTGDSPWSGSGLKIAVFPGSRPAIRRKALPYMTEFLASSRNLLPGSQWVVLLFPFGEAQEAAHWEKAGFDVATAGTGVVLAGADVALTQPGTNTLEMFHAGVPTVVALPEDFIAQIPPPVLLAPFFALPWIGPALKRRAFRRYIRKRAFLCWPNRLLGRDLYPEVTGRLSIEELAGRFASYAGDPLWRNETRQALSLADRGPKGAARQLKERILGNLA